MNEQEASKNMPKVAAIRYNGVCGWRGVESVHCPEVNIYESSYVCAGCGKGHTINLPEVKNE